MTGRSTFVESDLIAVEDARPHAPRPSALDAGARVIAVLRARDPGRCLPVVEQLVGAGVRMIELTMTTPGALELLTTVRDRFAEAADVGLGTVTDISDVVAAADRGAAFVVTPTTDEAIVRLCAERAVPVFPGGLTPTELYAGWRAGATAVKIFPADLVGVSYLGSLRGPFPELQVVPSGGVGLEDVADWIAAGALAVSLGGPLLADSLTGGDLAALRDRARRAVEATRTADEARSR